MDEIEINDNVKILKENDSYKIEFKTMQYELINSLLKTRIINGGSTDESYKFIYLKANKVITLKEYQNENKVKNGRLGILVSDAVKMLRSLVVQLNYLISKESCTILGYYPEEIIVINDEKFAYLGSELVAKIDEESNMAMISCPYSTSDFFVSPELLKIKELPSYVHFKTAYFSLALLIIYMLLGDREFYTEYLNHKHSENILTFLNNHPVKNSNFYWLLSRCLVEDAKDRSIILI
jgi:serine/threonine protein kinase